MKKAYLRQGNYLLDHSIVEIRRATEQEMEDLLPEARENMYAVSKVIHTCTGKKSNEIMEEVFQNEFHFDGQTFGQSSLDFITDEQAQKIIDIDEVSTEEASGRKTSNTLYAGFNDDVMEEGLSQAQKNI